MQNYWLEPPPRKGHLLIKKGFTQYLWENSLWSCTALGKDCSREMTNNLQWFVGDVHSKFSSKYASLLSCLLKITVTTESEVLGTVCNSCYLTMKKATKKLKNISTTSLSIFAWEPHSDDCELCLVAGGESSGERPKRKRKGRPRGDEPAYQKRRLIGRIADFDSPQLAAFPLDIFPLLSLS